MSQWHNFYFISSKGKERVWGKFKDGKWMDAFQVVTVNHPNDATASLSISAPVTEHGTRLLHRPLPLRAKTQSRERRDGRVRSFLMAFTPTLESHEVVGK